jgi:zinc transporter ZupT
VRENLKKYLVKKENIFHLLKINVKLDYDLVKENNKTQEDINNSTFDKSVSMLGGLYWFIKNNATSILLLTTLSIHSFFEGMAIGLVQGKFELLYLFIAITSHKWAEALFIVV